ncbi:DoxX family protein [Aeromicrobium marinum DSM 15272]|uniref:DoxX family protein n=1 Tax=Aeromicrobium marinum DSM 15272 TaxID=585531 RepID=E2SFE1_9ACTN|nr:DoxX family protein [Aeromicrobium marinum]EFQ82042.1 DoxX family protein [Aeromicrobium marinum DSM 15272]
MDEIFLIGRLMFCFLIVMSGVGHLMATDAMAGYAEMRGVSNAKLMTQVSGVALLAGGLSVALGIFGDLGALGLAILLVIMAVTMHAFWKETDAMNKQMEMVAFNKDIALAGGALVMFSILSSDFAPYTLVDPFINW